MFQVKSHLFSGYLCLQEVDIELRVVCEKFIQYVCDSLISPLSGLLSKVTIYTVMRLSLNVKEDGQFLFQYSLHRSMLW